MFQMVCSYLAVIRLECARYNYLVYFLSGILSLCRFNGDDVCAWEMQLGRLDDLMQKLKIPRELIQERRVTDLSWLDVVSPTTDQGEEDLSDICSVSPSGDHLRREGCS